MKQDQEEWDIVIEPKGSYFSLNLKEVWKYKDLLWMYVRRDVVTMYKQTVLGPLWYIIQPLFTTIMYMLVFGGIANIPTDGLPPMLFYMVGVLSWSYFAECLGRSSGTFGANAGVFSKVYFPRLVVPISGIISNLVKFGIQLALFICIYIYFGTHGYDIMPNKYAFLFPLLVFMLAGLGFGFGIIISSLTTKYRDLAILFGFVTQLWMYATPVIYPLSAIPPKYESFKWIIEANPLTSIVETMRYGFLGAGEFSWNALIYSLAFTFIIMLIGTWMFNRIERRFIDIV